MSNNKSLLAGLIAGTTEGLFFYPLDRIKNAAMGKSIQPSSTGNYYLRLLCGDQYASMSPLSRLTYTYQGGGTYIFLKAAQKTLLFPGQKEFKKQLTQTAPFQCVASQSTMAAHLTVASLSGSTMGALEVLTTQPVDRYKVLKQISPEKVQNISLMQFIRHGKLTQLYAGSGSTLARNIAGSGSTFFFYQLALNAMNKSDGKSLTGGQTLIATTALVFGRVIFPHPLDLIKVTQQKNPELGSLANTAKTIFTNEGWRGFAKGIVPKTMVTGGKFAATFLFYKFLDERLSSSNTPKP